MSYKLDWNEAALNTAAHFLSDDAIGLEALMNALDQLSHEPRPNHSSALGAQGLRRLHVGRYRALYEIGHNPDNITVIHIGRLG